MVKESPNYKPLRWTPNEISKNKLAFTSTENQPVAL